MHEEQHEIIVETLINKNKRIKELEERNRYLEERNLYLESRPGEGKYFQDTMKEIKEACDELNMKQN